MNQPAAHLGVIPVATAWTQGWWLTRDKAAPLVRPYGCAFNLGLPDNLERHVVIDFKADVLRELASRLHMPGTWLKVCAPAEQVAPLLPPRWRVQPAEYLMAQTLYQTTIAVPDGYRPTVRTVGPVTDVELRGGHDEMAAKGRVAHTDGFAVFDHIETSPRHQRKGLGRVVMATLSDSALAHGARTGVLLATEEGRALYHAIGWTVVSPVTAAVIV